MAITRGTALVATLRKVAQLTGQAGLDALETSELVLADVLVSASDVVFDRLKGDGVDPALLTTSAAFERVAAWTFLATLAATGHVRTPGEDPETTSGRFYALADKFYREAPVDLSSGDEPARAGGGVPSVGNMYGPGWVFGGGSGTGPGSWHNKGIPGRRT